jgi:isoleucyl-tRNA synthetase
MFREVNSKTDFAQLESDILCFWKGQGIFGKSIERRKKGPHYAFYEGPPTANGSPGVHSVLARLYKDVVCRYKAMKGYHLPRKGGWDTHGLPVELEVENSLALTSKAQIEEYGVARFNEHCRQSAFKYIKEWEAMTERLGYWVDMEHPYITLDNDYIESCWWIIKQLWDKGLIYQGYKVTPHCPRCGTSLSSHEVAQGYRDDAEDPSVYIKFRLVPSSIQEGTEVHSVLHPSCVSKRPTFFLAWTTTPWTLPGNTALAVAPNAEYSVMEGGQDYLIVATILADRVGLEGYTRLGVIPGRELVHLEYEPLFNPHSFGVPRLDLPSLAVRDAQEDLTYRVIGADFVSLDEGTGIVHIAPAFGEIDFDIGMSNALDFVQPVDLEGRVTGTYPFADKFVKDADPFIVDELESHGLLYRSGKIIHTYPFCWRCETPLLYYAKLAWYVRTTAMKEDLISGNDEISWYPDYIKRGRFGDWLENNVDWAFSRERYWGTPLNIWRCCSCGTFECVGSIDELRVQSSSNDLTGPLDLHRPYVDEIVFACPRCDDKMQRVPEVIDAWFDSGAMPVAQWHYPFENEDRFKQDFPADFICEAVDQTRGWFYSLHAISTLLFNRPCFRNVICHGHVVDARGEKMSKSKGNIVDPWTVFNNYGADALRWYMLVSTAAEETHHFSTKILEETTRKFLLTLWNTYSFFTLYANIDRFGPRPLGAAGDQSEACTKLDTWITSELNRLISVVSRLMDNYNPTAAARRIEEFVDILSNWYVRRNRRRFWKGETDSNKLAAYTTLYECLVTLSHLLAPFAPFVAEELYQNLYRSVDAEGRESVHLTDFPVADEAKISSRLQNEVELAMRITSLGRAARAKSGIKVRQPLSKAVVIVETDGEKAALESLAGEVMEEINVKQMVVLSEARAREEFSSDLPNYSRASDAKYCVAINTELPPELVAEGVSRELVRHVQNMRRNAKLNITDHIVTYYRTEEPSIRQVIHSFADYIKQETLSRELLDSLPPGGAHSEEYRISGKSVCLAIAEAKAGQV